MAVSHIQINPALAHGAQVVNAVRSIKQGLDALNDAFADVTTYSVSGAWEIPDTGTRLHASVGTGSTNPTFVEQFGFTQNELERRFKAYRERHILPFTRPDATGTN